jgi:transcriptional regulator with XRE-family HTH domain
MAKKRNTGFATRLRELRESAGLTQRELAERSGLHLGGLTKLEQGDREPAWSTVLDLAGALGVEVSAFVVNGAPPAPIPAPMGRPRKAPAQAQDTPEQGKATSAPSGQEKPATNRGGKRKAKE